MTTPVQTTQLKTLGTRQEPPIVPAPVIDEADADGFIDIESLRLGLTFRIPWFPEMKPGGRMNAAFFNEQGSVGKEVYVGEEMGDLLVRFGASDVRFLEGTRFTAHYIYHDDLLISPPAPFEAGAALPRPVVDDARDGAIPIEASSGPVNARIPPYEGMAEGDLVRLYVAGSQPHGSAILPVLVEQSDVGHDMLLSLHESLMTFNQNGSVHLMYSVASGGQERVSAATSYPVQGLIQPVIAEYEYDPGTSAPTLPLTYEGDGCIPVRVDLNLAAQGGEVATLLLMSDRHGDTWLIRQAVASDERSLQFCIPASLLQGQVDKMVHITCLLDSSGTVTGVAPRAFHVGEQ